MSVPTTAVRIDEATKWEVKPILEELGLDLSSATNIFLRAVIRCGGLPFDLRLAEQPATPSVDFVATYLAPIMSPRNEINRIMFDLKRYRRRLEQRKELLNEGRRHVE